MRVCASGVDGGKGGGRGGRAGPCAKCDAVDNGCLQGPACPAPTAAKFVGLSRHCRSIWPAVPCTCAWLNASMPVCGRPPQQRPASHCAPEPQLTRAAPGAHSHTAQDRLAYLRRVREGGDVAEVMFAVRSDLLRNLGNMTNMCAALRCAAPRCGCAVSRCGCAVAALCGAVAALRCAARYVAARRAALPPPPSVSACACACM